MSTSKPVLVLQPGGHGDIIIFAPIAQHHLERGRRVIWPIPDTQTYRELTSHLPGIEWVYLHCPDGPGLGAVGPCLDHGYGLADAGEVELVDLASSVIGARRKLEPRDMDKSFAIFKYEWAGLDPKLRYSLKWERNLEREQELRRQILGDSREPYSFFHSATYAGHIDLGEAKYRKVETREVSGFSVFDWLPIMLEAAEVKCLDSSFANLLEIMPEAKGIEKHVWMRGSGAQQSIYFNTWEVHYGRLRPVESGRMDLPSSALQFELPEALCNHGPTPDRGEGRVLVVDRAARTIVNRPFPCVREYLEGREVWVNNSKVLPHVVRCWRDTGQSFRMHLLDQRSPTTWVCMPVLEHRLIRTGDDRGWFTHVGHINFRFARTVEHPGRWLVEFDREFDLDEIGEFPTPPGMQKPETRDEWKMYESLYASVSGGSAIPTAGVPLSRKILDGLDLHYVTLHPSVDNIRRINTSYAKEHAQVMTHEWYSMAEFPDAPVLCVGSTVVKALETAALTGKLEGWSRLFIYRPYVFKKTAALLTNLHFTREPLTAMVEAMLGPDLWRESYGEAIRLKFRFGDYGDSMLIL